MTTSISKAGLVLGCVLSACAEGRPVLDEPLGAAGQPFCRGGFAVANVVIDPTTIHTDDPHQLLFSGEGCGPRTLDVFVSSSIAPSISYTGTYTPTDSEISKALGYSVTESITIQADSTVDVPVNAYARVDAYPTFQRAAYQVVGSVCPGQLVVGTGVALKPVGVYFETCGIIGTDSCSATCIDGRPPGLAPPVDPADAGAGDGG